jgi:DNA-binding GntR family transcriptional regulator
VVTPKTKKTKKSADSTEALTQKAYRGIRQKLFFNEISPGQKIYYHDVADDLGMSPTPVIQALKWLEYQGLVRHENNRGFFLEPISIDEIKDIFQLRKIVEVDLLEKGYTKITKKKINIVREALNIYDKTLEENNRKKQSLAARDFHLTLSSVANSPVSFNVVKNLFDLMYLKYQVDILFTRYSNNDSSRHREIFHKLENNDLQGACEGLANDIENVGNMVVRNMIKNIEEKEELSI